MAEELNEIKKKFEEFLEEVPEERSLTTTYNSGCTHVVVDLDELRAFDRKFANRLLSYPATYYQAMEIVLGQREQEKNQKSSDQKILISFCGSFGQNHVSPRELLSSFMGKIVSVDGIVTKCSMVRPKMVQSSQYCTETKELTRDSYPDFTEIYGKTNLRTYRTRDKDGHILITEYGREFSVYRDNQSITIQEMPENAPAGQLPRSVDVVLERDLVDKCKPGDRVNVIGIYKAIPTTTINSGIFRTALIALNVRQLNKEVSRPTLSEKDIEAMKKLKNMAAEQLLELLGRSLAPSVCGHETLKQALILLLLGGTEKNLHNGAHIRGDINCLLVGDPSVAKSQLLRCVMRVARYAISTTGRGSSGVGLTAAVTTDQETGERRLEAGAMVLADKGVVCIDEFDKMSDADRVAIHEVMEQQTVTIAKAGIHASLNARCSVLAAANPIYGNYDHSQGVTRNINLPDSLLSRFDMLFIVLDNSNPEIDRKISTHVLNLHSTRIVPLMDSVDSECAHEDEDFMYQRKGKEGFASKSELLSRRSLQKYLHYIHRKYLNVGPELCISAESFIAEQYSLWRSSKADDMRNRRSIPITARTLETLIRLSTAHAKMRLSGKVERMDAMAAVEIVRHAIEAEDLKNAASFNDVTRLDTGMKNRDERRTTFEEKFRCLIHRRETIELESVLGLGRSCDLNDGETEEIIKNMQENNRLLVSEGTIHLI